MNDLKYGQRIIETPNDDGSVEIITEGYTDGLQTVREQRRENIQTSYGSILADVVACLDVLKSGTPELIIRITKDKTGTPTLIQKTWLISKQKIK